MDGDTINAAAVLRKPQPRNPCIVPGCGRPHWARGYCGSHYQQFRSSGKFSVVVNAGTPEERFARSYQIDAVTGCWEWTGWRNDGGYGILRIPPNEKKRAHRLSYELHVGPIPDGVLVCHQCDNRGCVNPGHLYLGSARDNTQDMLRKGRAPIRAGRPLRKLTWPMVATLRVLYARGTHSLASLADLYGIDDETARKVVKGEAWLNPPG